MAHLKKGILGTPKGKIGNVMGYSKNGKGILQSLPKTTEPYLRYWPLLRWKLLNRLKAYWILIEPTLSTYWATFQKPGETLEEAFIRVNLDLVFNNRWYSLNGCLAGADTVSNITYLKTIGNRYDHFLYSSFSGGVPPEPVASQTRMSSRFYLPDKSFLTVNVNWASGFFDGISLAGSPTASLDQILHIYFIRQFTPSWRSWYVIVDDYDKEFDYENFN